MKKVIVSVLFILFFSKSYAQENFGVFTGLNYSYFTEGLMEKTYAERSFAFHIGVLYNLKFSKKISFRPKVSFSQQGDRTETTQDNSSFDLSQIDSRLNYINLALDFKFGDKIYLLTGPQIGYLINQKKISQNFVFIDKNIDVGLNLGGGFTINNLFFELGLYQGLATIAELQESFSNNLSKIKNGYAKLTVGYNF